MKAARAAPVKAAHVKAAPVKATPVKAAQATAAAVPTGPAKSSPATATATATASPAAEPASARARTQVVPAVTPPPAEDAWTAGELAAIRTELEGQARELRGEIVDAEQQSAAIQRDASTEGSGDEADAGTKTFEREHEMSLANNSRDLLLQVERALARLDAGTYGRCETCGDPIPKARLQAFPRATLCVRCKQREERR